MTELSNYATIVTLKAHFVTIMGICGRNVMYLLCFVTIMGLLSEYCHRYWYFCYISYLNEVNCHKNESICDSNFLFKKLM